MVFYLRSLGCFSQTFVKLPIAVSHLYISLFTSITLCELPFVFWLYFNGSVPCPFDNLASSVPWIFLEAKMHLKNCYLLSFQLASLIMVPCCRYIMRELERMGSLATKRCLLSLFQTSLIVYHQWNLGVSNG